MSNQWWCGYDYLQTPEGWSAGTGVDDERPSMAGTGSYNAEIGVDMDSNVYISVTTSRQSSCSAGTGVDVDSNGNDSPTVTASGSNFEAGADTNRNDNNVPPSTGVEREWQAPAGWEAQKQWNSAHISSWETPYEEAEHSPFLSLLGSPGSKSGLGEM